uniref:Rhomboid family intramembrane serine protease n=1 Tax=Geobacter metallireducens TaxID=28232 RepID=A0A831XFH6_GEOME
MIPLKDYNPTRRFPLVSVAFIVLNIIAFILDRLSGHYEPLLIETARGLVRTRQFVGGLSADYALVPAALTSHPLLAWPTMFSSMFLHGNWLHIGSNMLYLWIFGNNVEDVLGRVRFIVFYFGCGIAAALAQVASAPGADIPMVGASGAVAGVMGAYLLLFPHARILTLVPIIFFFTFIEVPAFIIIGYWVLIQFLNANWLGGGEMQGGVAYFAHIGGFVAGVLFLWMTGTGRRGGYRGR